MQSLAISAWAFSEPPALVEDLESAFLANVSRHLDGNTLVSDSSRAEIHGLIDRSAPAREVGDVLFMAYAKNWAARLQSRFGAREAQLSWHDRHWIYRPFQGFVPSPCDSGEVLEVSCPSQMPRELSAEALKAGMGLVQVGFASLPFHCLLYPPKKRDRMVLRFFSPTLMEEGLLHFFGRRAARFCMAPGFVSPDENLQLHRLGYHAFGIPMQSTKFHSFDSEPLGFAAHDAGHAAFWSAHTSPADRLAACVAYEVAEEVLTPAQKNQFEAELDLLQDLHMKFFGGVLGILKGWKPLISEMAFRRMGEAFLERWGAVCSEVGLLPEFVSVRRQVQAFFTSE